MRGLWMKCEIRIGRPSTQNVHTSRPQDLSVYSAFRKRRPSTKARSAVAGPIVLSDLNPKYKETIPFTNQLAHRRPLDDRSQGWIKTPRLYLCARCGPSDTQSANGLCVVSIFHSISRTFPAFFLFSPLRFDEAFTETKESRRLRREHRLGYNYE